MIDQNNPVFKNESAEMLQAFQHAQDNFKYFWREMYWEYRRIIPAFDIAYVKIAFSQQTADPENPLVEFMWINEVEFDGENITGILLNEPYEIDNVEAGQQVMIPFDNLVDWMFVSMDEVYGAFSIQEYRKTLNPQQCQDYDHAWNINFADPEQIYVVHGQKLHPEYLIEHPMSNNLKDKIEEHLRNAPELLTELDDAGNSFLHREAIAGNASNIEIALRLGAQADLKNKLGKTALDYAVQMNWPHLLPILNPA